MRKRSLLFPLGLFLFLSLCFFSCATRVDPDDVSFLEEYGVLPGGEKHTPYLPEIFVLPLLQELDTCTVDCGTLRRDIRQLRRESRRYHRWLGRNDLPKLGCPCTWNPYEHCPWEKEAVLRYINDNEVLTVNNLRILDESGLALATVQERANSPTGRFTFFLLGPEQNVPLGPVILEMDITIDDRRLIKTLPVEVIE